MLVDDKQAREKIATYAENLRWLITYEKNGKLTAERLEEIATCLESLSAQVAEKHTHTFCPLCNPCRRAEEITPLEDALRSLASYVGNGGYNSPNVNAAEFEAKIRDGIDRLSATAEAQVAELQQKSIATRAFDCKELEAQVAELKRDLQKIADYGTDWPCIHARVALRAAAKESGNDPS